MLITSFGEENLLVMDSWSFYFQLHHLKLFFICLCQPNVLITLHYANVSTLLYSQSIKKKENKEYLQCTEASECEWSQRKQSFFAAYNLEWYMVTSGSGALTWDTSVSGVVCVWCVVVWHWGPWHQFCHHSLSFNFKVVPCKH